MCAWKMRAKPRLIIKVDELDLACALCSARDNADISMVCDNEP